MRGGYSIRQTWPRVPISKPHYVKGHVKGPVAVKQRPRAFGAPPSSQVEHHVLEGPLVLVVGVVGYRPRPEVRVDVLRSHALRLLP